LANPFAGPAGPFFSSRPWFPELPAGQGAPPPVPGPGSAKSVSITIGAMHVREEADIHKVARELFYMEDRAKRRVGQTALAR
jgi:hypothetical protein